MYLAGACSSAEVREKLAGTGKNIENFLESVAGGIRRAA